MLPGDPVAEWPREAVSVGWQRRTAVSESFHALPHGLGVTTHHATKIVVARIAVVGEQPLELDFPAGAVTSHLRKVLDG
jgi:antitoxin component of RelBE/YafQ-DinJ toxin-antitoxin module